MPPKAKGKPGTKGQKQIVDENKQTLHFYAYIIAGVNILYGLLQTLVFWDSFTTRYWVMFVLALVIYTCCYQFMMYMARAVYSSTGALIDGGVDLNMEAGLAEHLKDIILLTAVTQALTLLSGYFWLLLLLIPTRAFYLLWVHILGPWFFAEAPPEIDQKKLKKKERKQQQIRYR